MRRAWVPVAAGIAVLVLIGWAIKARHALPPQEPGTAPGAAGTQVRTSLGAEPTVAIELLLLPDAGIRAVPGSVRIGLGQVAADNAAAAPALLDGQQAGPSGYDELATVDRWISVPAHSLPDGRVRVGPFRLPVAERYTLQARGEDGLRFYAASFKPGSVPTAVSPIVGAGLRVHAHSRGAQVLLRRMASSASPPVWQRLQEWIAPDLLEAFSEQPLPVTNRQVLVPLAPGEIEIVLEIDGVEAERRQVSLPVGRVVDVRFDPTNEAVARAVSIDLELEFVKQGSGEPVAGLEVSWLSGRAQRSGTTDVRGRVTFEGLDRQQEHQFSLVSKPVPGRLPEWPELRPLQVTPDELAAYPDSAETVRHRVELAPLRWLIARPPAAAARMKPHRRSPYPIYVLQRQRGRLWFDTAADHFVDIADGLAVSVAEPGIYRVAVALSPWQMLVSDGAQVAGPGRPTVAFPDARAADTTVTVLRDGKRLAGAPVHIIGPVGNLPPAILKADANGRVTLTSATVPTVRVEVPGSDQIEVRLSAPQAVADFGLQRSE